MPVAFAFKDVVEEHSNDRKDTDDDLDSDFGDMSIQGSDSFRDADYSSTESEASGPEIEAQQGSESSYAAPKISEVAAGKRPASGTTDDDRAPKRVRPFHANASINSSTPVKIPPTLTLYKQERTILHVLLPGSTTETVPIKLRSAVTMSTFFSSVSAAVGDYEHMAVAVTLGDEDGGQNQTIIVKRNIVDTFEFFLEVIDEARCWEEEGGRMALQLQSRWPYV